MYILPKTKPGKWAFGLVVLFFLLFFLFQLLVASGQTGGETFFDNLFLSIPVFLAGASAITAGICGVVAIIKFGERAVSVFLIVVLGLMVLKFILGEFLSPH